RVRGRRLERRGGCGARAGVLVFQRHGTDVPVGAYDIGGGWRDSGGGQGLGVEWGGFGGGHEIPREVVEGVGEFLRRV
ncbi:MAG: hypothetical protein MPJ22_03030, partial [Pirellulales bacterium]|nr:hypothetical protein [Pirellulales bacterium]